MNMIKKLKILTVITYIIFFSVLTACSTAKDSATGEKLKIVTTLFPQYDFAKQITGDLADVTLLLTPGAESHTYEPTPKDMLKIQNADIFIYVGGESEVWVEDALKSAKSDDHIKTLRLMDYVTPIEEAHHDSVHDDSNHDEMYDEHIFTSLRNSKIILDKISEEICAQDSKNSSTYRENTDVYMDELANLDEKFTDLTANAKRKTVVFGDRFPFAYFANDYGLDCHAAFSGCSSETEASSATISELINIVKSESIPTVFYIEFSSQAIADKIADATDVKTALLHSCHNISKEDIEKETSYADLMEQNYKNLLEALN